jgi:transposase-like protein
MASSLRKYDQETRDRAVRMYRERRRDVPGESAVAAQRRVGELLDVNRATLRGWVERAEVDSGTRPGTTTETATELALLRRENAELRRANEILKTASAFFAAAELDRRLR